MAIQDASGTWWNLVLPGRADIGWFDPAPGSSSETDAAITSAEAALSAGGGGALHFPGSGWTFTSQRKPTAGVHWNFDGQLNSTLLTNEWGTLRSYSAENFTLDGPHVGTRQIARHLNVNVVGSGTDLSATGDNAFEVTIQKNNWRNPALAASGEFAGVVVNARQGGPSTGIQNSLSGFGADVGTVTGAGFCAQWEGVTTQFGLIADGTPIVARQVFQYGIINSRTGTRIGAYHQAVTGTMEVGTYYRSESGAAWGDIIRSSVGSVGGWMQFKVSDLGLLTWRQADDNAKTITARGDNLGAFVIENYAGDDLAKIDQTGFFSTRGNIGIRAEATGNSTSYLDFYSDSSGSYTTRLSRSSGANGVFKISQIGSGALQIAQDGTGALEFYSNGGIKFNGQAVSYLSHGNTASRPTGLGNTINIGFRYFDQTLGKPIFWNGTGWIDAAGTSV
jgi:hypothetical protein